MHGESEDTKFGMIEISLDVQVSGTFSVLVASDFSDMFPYMTLFRKHHYPHSPLISE